jgi:hypothetical protein
MSTTTTPPTDVPEDQLGPAVQLSTTLRVAAATTLVLGAGLQAAAWLVYAEPNLTAAYTAVKAGAGRPDVSLALNVLATPFWIASVPVYVLLGRTRSPRLAWVGGTLLVAGLTALGTNLGTEIMTSFLVREAAISPAQADQATRALSSPPASVMSMVFLLGVAVGIPLTAAALWRSRAVPRAAAALLVVFLLVDIAGQSTLIPFLGVIAHVIGLVAATWIAVTVVRMPRSNPNRLAAQLKGSRNRSPVESADRRPAQSLGPRAD